MHLQAWISTPLFAGFFLAVIADSGIITRSNALATNTLLRHGVRGYIYPDMSHLKAAVYDGGPAWDPRTWIASACAPSRNEPGDTPRSSHG